MLSINDIKFEPRADCEYAYNYGNIRKLIKSGKWDERTAFRNFAIQDPFFFVYFVMGLEKANHPFVVERCKELEKTPLDKLLALWAREHYKSTLITTVKLLQCVLANPEERIAIFSYSKSAAIKLMSPAKMLLEKSEFLKWLFPDILYANPAQEAERWSDEIGLRVKCKSIAKENTIEAHGLIEGMPTGGHYTKRFYDDVETADLAKSPSQMAALKEAFSMSHHLGAIGGEHCVVGTTYTHMGLLQELRDKKDLDGNSVYRLSLQPATHDGTPNGRPVLHTEKRLEELKLEENFAAQQLLDPTPRTRRPIKYENIKHIDPGQIPRNLFKFMMVDGAGENKRKRMEDSWGMAVVGVRPYRDDVGNSDIYILDLLIEPMEHDRAIDEVVNMYIRAGRVMKLGVEKVSMNTTEIHVSKALQAKGINVTIENKGLEILRPAGRSKQDRITGNLQLPLRNGKIWLSTAIPNAYKERLRIEMDKFPHWHDDGLDTISYVYDLFKDFRFREFTDEDRDEENIEDEVEADEYEKENHSDDDSDGWMIV